MNDATLDEGHVSELGAERLGSSDKGVPPAWWGRTVRELAGAGTALSQWPTPLFTLSRDGLADNTAALAAWCSSRGLDLAPHGKTTMAPQLWQRQLEAGAWALTVANFPQLAVARRFGVSRVMVANAVISPLTLDWVADQLSEDPAFELMVWADSLQAVALMGAALGAAHERLGPAYRPLTVLVELGGAGGRTGARDESTALAVADAVATSAHMELGGVAGYEGALAHDDSAESLEVVADYLRSLARFHALLRDRYTADVTPVVTAGGSAYFDVVADILGPLIHDGARVVLRSGAYIAHDDGFYRDISPLGNAPRSEGHRLRSAMHGWVRITSQPEPGLAIFDAGKRDLPFDEGLPEPQLIRDPAGGEPRLLTSSDGFVVTALNDQHGFLRFPVGGPAQVKVGDELRLGLSHPCTAFDKWRLIPVIDDPDAPDPVVVDLIRTYF